MNKIEIIKQKLAWIRKASWFDPKMRETTDQAVDLCLTVIEDQERRVAALEKQLKAVCHG